MEYNSHMAVFISHSPAETVEFAREYAKNLKGGDVVVLSGDLGAGKTQFAKGVALFLGIKEDILSPTYAYMNDYGGKLYHFDFYRLKSGEQAEAMGLCDYFYGDGISLIEWGENVESVLPQNTKKVEILKLSDRERKIIYE